MASTKKNILSSLYPLGYRELRSQFKTPGFIILLVRKLQAGVGGPIARKPQVSSTLFYFF